MGLTLAEALRLLPHLPYQAPSPNPFEFGEGWRRVAFVGAGGKTTAMFQLARELPPPVIVTATTHLGTWQIPLADHHIIAETPGDLGNREFKDVTLVTASLRDDDRVSGVDEDILYWLHASCQEHEIPLLIEADGAHQKPLKAPADHEPNIPKFVDTVAVVSGISALGKPLSDEFVHRPEIFARLSGLEIGQTISTEAIARVLAHTDGGLKNIPPFARRVALLNQADSPELQAQAHALASDLLSSFDSVIIASLQQKIIYAVHEPVAGIILAAGASTRFGRPKQLLDWRRQPFVRAIAKTALDAGLSPVVIVTGANAEQVEAVIRDLPVQIARNEEWQSGQSSSIRAGLLSITSPPPSFQDTSTKTSRFGGGRQGAVVILLSDQPQIQSSVIRALIEAHAAGLSPIVAPLVLMEQRANPVLFDRITFSDLLQLTGDVGGRAIFSKHRVEFMPWHDDRLLLDVDRPEDYQRLIEDETL